MLNTETTKRPPFDDGDQKKAVSLDHFVSQQRHLFDHYDDDDNDDDDDDDDGCGGGGGGCTTWWLVRIAPRDEGALTRRLVQPDLH